VALFGNAFKPDRSIVPWLEIFDLNADGRSSRLACSACDNLDPSGLFEPLARVAGRPLVETAAKRRVPNWHAYVLTTWNLSRIVVPSGSELTVYDINRRAEAMRIPSTVPVLLTDKLLVTRDTRHLLRLHMF
jgi:hypothetical protein